MRLKMGRLGARRSGRRYRICSRRFRCRVRRQYCNCRRVQPCCHSGDAQAWLRPAFGRRRCCCGRYIGFVDPPSAILVIYAIIVEESVGALLLAGFIPGIVSALIYAVIIMGRATVNPKLGPPVRGFTFGERMNHYPGRFLLLLLLALFSAPFMVVGQRQRKRVPSARSSFLF